MLCVLSPIPKTILSFLSAGSSLQLSFPSMTYLFPKKLLYTMSMKNATTSKPLCYKTIPYATKCNSISK